MRIATDIGGTFTDLVCIDEENCRMVAEKSHTTPPNFEQGVLDVIKKSGLSPESIDTFIHGTTTIINALTERKGGKTGLITTKGFRDVLEIARCNRPDLFNLVFHKPEPFIPRYLRREVAERMNYKGEVIQPLNEEDVKSAVKYFKEQEVESIGICYINSYANDEHEQKTAEIIRSLWPEVFITTSSTVTREWREYERTSTVALNSYVMPTASSYLNNLSKKLESIGFKGKSYIMQSNGGTTTFDQAKEAPINMVESGPVAGVYGSAILGQIIGESNLIAFDVGGTTAKCSLIDNGEVKVTTEYRIGRTDNYAGYPIMAPVVDIVEIGNGGGSIAWIDEAGSLRVGPQSAGAVPGPVAYGIGGTEPTTTDACLLTGRLSPSNFDNPVDMEAVKSAIVKNVGEPLGLNADDAAMGIIRVAESNMYNALKLVSIRRGYDPREFTMVAFGGGGPMHCASLARELNIKKMVVPVAASVFAAWGMLMTDLRHDYIRTHISPLDGTPVEEINDIWKDIQEQAEKQFLDDGIPASQMICQYYVDMRYLGQEHTVKVPVPAVPLKEEDKEIIKERFHEAHEQAYTFRLPNAPVEIVNYHLVGNGGLTPPKLQEIAPQTGDVEEARISTRPVCFNEIGWLDTPVYDRSKLGSGAQFSGPVVIEEKTSSTVVYPGQNVLVDKYGNLIITEEGE
ncbi:MAG TPA: hydantoinase/oxoprolinase family protein [Clostridia bacterium]|nr:hydantoinase/oxoprolinase family protein [Clostridia bacterium]